MCIRRLIGDEDAHMIGFLSEGLIGEDRGD